MFEIIKKIFKPQPKLCDICRNCQFNKQTPELVNNCPKRQRIFEIRRKQNNNKEL